MHLYTASLHTMHNSPLRSKMHCMEARSSRIFYSGTSLYINKILKMTQFAVPHIMLDTSQPLASRHLTMNSQVLSRVLTINYSRFPTLAGFPYTTSGTYIYSKLAITFTVSWGFNVHPHKQLDCQESHLSIPLHLYKYALGLDQTINGQCYICILLVQNRYIGTYQGFLRICGWCWWWWWWWWWGGKGGGPFAWKITWCPWAASQYLLKQEDSS